MNTFIIDLEDATGYEIEAETKEEAIMQALEWWGERMPKITVQIEN